MERETLCRPTRIDIDLDAVAHNVKALKERVSPETEVLVMVKANAYGHGAVPIAKHVLENGATQLGVATLGEALELRHAGIEAPILVFGYTNPGCWKIAQRHEVSLTFFEKSQVEQATHELGKEGNPLRIHLKIDTGMGRLGFRDLSAFIESIQFIEESNILQFDGVFTHFARADEADFSFTEQQLATFKKWVNKLKTIGRLPKYIHSNNSAATIQSINGATSLVRLGISAYGLYPSPYLKETEKVLLKPCLRLSSTIVQLKEVPPQTPISYGGTYVTDNWSKIATVPIGYGDGYSRSHSNRGEVLIHGKRARIVGRVTMDQLMVDVSHLPEVKAGDEVVFIGSQGTEQITADELAEIIGTINYEITTALLPRIPRFYLPCIAKTSNGHF